MFWIRTLQDLIRFADSKKHLVPNNSELQVPGRSDPWDILTRYSMKEKKCSLVPLPRGLSWSCYTFATFTWFQSPQVGIINLNGVITILYEPQWIHDLGPRAREEQGSIHAYVEYHIHLHPTVSDLSVFSILWSSVKSYEYLLCS